MQIYFISRGYFFLTIVSFGMDRTLYSFITFISQMSRKR